jgi:hypothetical protein
VEGREGGAGGERCWVELVQCGKVEDSRWLEVEGRADEWAPIIGYWQGEGGSAGPAGLIGPNWAATGLKKR